MRAALEWIHQSIHARLVRFGQELPGDMREDRSIDRLKDAGIGAAG